MLRWLGFAIGVVALVAVAVVAWIGLGPGPLAFAKGTRVALADYRGPNPTGVPASLAAASPVTRGEYLARAADCVACHTGPSGRAFAGGYPIRSAAGTIHSTNITPDQETGIGGYTDAQFIAAMRDGIRRDGQRLYPAMPFATYAQMTDADILAIKAYLLTLPAVRAPAQANDLRFPFDRRPLIAVWSAFFNREGRFRPNRDQSPEWNRGAYLAEAMAHCGECHTPRNPLFGLNNRAKYAGAVNGGWRAHNITGDKASGVGGWTADALAQYLATGYAAGHGVAAGSMGAAVDEALTYLDPSDIRALVTYLRTVPAVGNVPAIATTVAPDRPDAGPAGDANGRALYGAACQGCHGWNGVSPVDPHATIAGTRTLNDPNGTNVVQAVLRGVHRRLPEGVLPMPAFGTSHSDDEVAALVNYATARIGGHAAGISAADVARLRRETTP